MSFAFKKLLDICCSQVTNEIPLIFGRMTERHVHSLRYGLLSINIANGVNKMRIEFN